MRKSKNSRKTAGRITHKYHLLRKKKKKSMKFPMFLMIWKINFIVFWHIHNMQVKFETSDLQKRK